MKQETRYLISDAAKKVAVESHVLRYWEEELKLPIKRNELGHRYYTEDDILRFQEVKALKEQGLQLKAIRMILRNGKLEPFAGKEIAGKEIINKETVGKDIFGKSESLGNESHNGGNQKSSQEERNEEEIIRVKESFREKESFYDKGVFHDKEPKHILMVNSNEIMSVTGSEPAITESKESKSQRLQQLLQQMITEAVRTNNRELCDDIKESMLKELDYQFRLQEEREEERIRAQIDRDDRYYQKIDELLRGRNKKLRPEKESTKAINKESTTDQDGKGDGRSKGGLFKKTK
ncbi:MAG: helix-turn-helix domain-containing protein [Lachnospiraceae bacterium]|nr:helix-turn-helix domain-containing protein [Lachnospiraceae bacterium]